MRVQVCTCAYRYVHTRTGMCIHVQVCIGMCMRVQVCTCAYRYVHTRSGMCIHVQVCAYTYRYVYTRTGMCMRVQVCACTYRYVHVRTGMCLHVQVCAYIHLQLDTTVSFPLTKPRPCSDNQSLSMRSLGGLDGLVGGSVCCPPELCQWYRYPTYQCIGAAQWYRYPTYQCIGAAQQSFQCWSLAVGGRQSDSEVSAVVISVISGRDAL